MNRKKPKKRIHVTNRKKAIRVLSVLLIVLIVTAGLVAVSIFNGFYSLLNYKPLDNSEKHIPKIDNAVDVQSDEKVLNILLIGTDDRSAAEMGRSDTMMLLTVNEKSHTLGLTSFMRDIYLDIPGHKPNRLNTPYRFGGVSLLKATIEQNFSVEIDRYAVMDFSTFMDVVDAIGGVEVKLTKDEIWYVNVSVRQTNDSLHLPREDGVMREVGGTYLLNGKQALGYARIRKIGGDFQRTSRQRIVIGAILNKVRTLSYNEMLSLAQLVLPQVTTDLTKSDVSDLLFKAASILGYERVSLRVPADNAYDQIRVDGIGSVIRVDLPKNREMLREKLHLK